MSGADSLNPHHAPQIKVCGLTRVDEAVACARLGADAVGLIFYSPSPRFVSDEAAREICLNLPESACPVGVFVNEDYAFIKKKIATCGLRAVQLHGTEPPDLVDALTEAGVLVIKSLFLSKSPTIQEACGYRASAYLIESGEGPLPGGNASAWNWEAAVELPANLLRILAGGLDSGNVADGIETVCPDAVDVSSGVEAAPGRKDLTKVKNFVGAVRNAKLRREPRRIFQ
jgi:phosphoribosylanthranilate isomerase